MSGLAMFACAAALMIATGLPVYAVLLLVSAAFAAGGVALGAFEPSLLRALPLRLVGLLEHDLLQALPLYAFIGSLLTRLPLAALLQRGGQRLAARALPRNGAGAELAALGVGALLAPMNGSVGASLHMLARSAAPALATAGVSATQASATVCVASTLGVVIPPSLVLMLLGDAMMRAHTEAANATHAMVRIVNTQDVMRAALLPGAAVLLIALALAAWRGRGRAASAPPPVPWREALGALSAAIVIGALLAGVAIGRLYAVEAAATGGVLLFALAMLTGRVTRRLMREVLDDTLTLTGILFALLVGATTFSLLLRGFGTDRMIADALQSLAGHPTLLLLGVLGGLVACSFVLDAFELIFLVIPLVMPPLLMTVTDAAWVAALTLLVLQAGFLLPPFGYAFVMSRSMLPGAPGVRALTRALLPQLIAQALLIAVVISWPQTTQWLRPETSDLTSPAPDVDALMQQAVDAARGARSAAASDAAR